MMLGKRRITNLFVIICLIQSIFTVSVATTPSRESESFTALPRQPTVVEDVTDSFHRPISVGSKINTISTLTTHSPITIVGDANFTGANGVVSGTGSEHDPYIISNWFIDSNDTSDCIQIVNTTNHFIIENCTLIDAGGYSGISLVNVTNGHLTNNVCNTTSIGIYLFFSSSNTLTNNNCSSNTDYGIFLENCSSNTLSNNDCYDNNDGIFLDFCSSNILTNNNCGSNYCGILLGYSWSNALTRNTCNNNTGYGITFVNSSFNTLNANICNDNIEGIYFPAFSRNNTLTCNTCKYNSRGIRFDFEVDYNTISTNVISNNSIGIHFEQDSNYNLIYSNWIWGNSLNISEDSGPNDIFGNFDHPPSSVDDLDYDGLTDLQEIAIGTNPISVDSDNDNFMDLYEVTYGTDPLDANDYPIPPVVDIITPIATISNQNSVILAYSTSGGVVTIYTNNVANSTSQPSGSLLSDLSDGSYNLTIVVEVPLGTQDKETVLFTIDTTPPTVSITSPTNAIYDQASVTLTYTVSEGTVTVYTNGIANTTTQQSGSILSDLADGTYTITIVAVDEAGNTGIAIVAFAIDTTTTTIPTTTIPTTTTTPTTTIPTTTTSITTPTTTTNPQITLATQTQSTAEFATLAIFTAIIGIYLLRRRQRYQ